MMLNHLRCLQSNIYINCNLKQQKIIRLCSTRMQTVKAEDQTDITSSKNEEITEIFTSARVVPLMLSKEPVVLSFDEIPGPKVLKYLSNARNYVSRVGTQLTAGALTFGLNFKGLMNDRRPITGISALFDEYGPVVRFVSPFGADIVLLNNPNHIQKVFVMEGDYPVRSSLDSLEQYRKEHRHYTSGLYSIHGPEWIRQRSVVINPMQSAVTQNIMSLNDVCEGFTHKMYNLRNQQDEILANLYKEIHKWAFDCMVSIRSSYAAEEHYLQFHWNWKYFEPTITYLLLGVHFLVASRRLNIISLVIFSKKFSMLDTELVYSQCDMSWLYHSLEKATEAILACESGFRLWKLLPTPSWYSLIKHCDNLDNLIGKHVFEAEHALSIKTAKDDTVFTKGIESLIASMLVGDNKLSTEDINTVLMDMLLIGVNTISSSTSFLLFYLAKYQKAQKILYREIQQLGLDMDSCDFKKLKESTPYLQACIKETLRLVPPIPIITRVLPKNITLDKYNIPRGTLIIMSTRDSSQKEMNFDDADKFQPERWLNPEFAQNYHTFASIPFGYGARKCVGQNVAETMMSMLTVQLLNKFKLEYHYADIEPTREFIVKPNKPLKIRFVDRM